MGVGGTVPAGRASEKVSRSRLSKFEAWIEQTDRRDRTH